MLVKSYRKPKLVRHRLIRNIYHHGAIEWYVKRFWELTVNRVCSGTFVFWVHLMYCCVWQQMLFCIHVVTFVATNISVWSIYKVIFHKGTEISRLESFIPMERRYKWKYFQTPSVDEGHDNIAVSNKEKNNNLKLFCLNGNVPIVGSNLFLQYSLCGTNLHSLPTSFYFYNILKGYSNL